MALTIKKSWYDKLVPLSSEERAQILDDVMMYYFTDNPGEYNHGIIRLKNGSKNSSYIIISSGNHPNIDDRPMRKGVKRCGRGYI